MCFTSLNRFGKSDKNTYSVRLSKEHSLHRPIICPNLLVGVWKAYSDGGVNEEKSVKPYMRALTYETEDSPPRWPPGEAISAGNKCTGPGLELTGNKDARTVVT
jgi:hypothetical protein